MTWSGSRGNIKVKNTPVNLFEWGESQISISNIRRWSEEEPEKNASIIDAAEQETTCAVGCSEAIKMSPVSGTGRNCSGLSTTFHVPGMRLLDRLQD